VLPLQPIQQGEDKFVVGKKALNKRVKDKDARSLAQGPAHLRDRTIPQPGIHREGRDKPPLVAARCSSHALVPLAISHRQQSIAGSDHCAIKPGFVHRLEERRLGEIKLAIHPQRAISINRYLSAGGGPRGILGKGRGHGGQSRRFHCHRACRWGESQDSHAAGLEEVSACALSGFLLSISDTHAINSWASSTLDFFI
jgi:hypothetical protein